MTTSEAVALSHVTVMRGSRLAVDDLTATIPSGEVVGLLGPSGCGKTTLLRSIVGIQANVQGDITVLGRPSGDATLRRQIGYRAQELSLYQDLTVAENVEYFAALLDVGVDRRQAVIETVRLGSAVDQRVGELSGGQQARVSLVVALLAEPRLLVLDEPTVGLDPVLRRDLWNLFSALASDGTTLLVSSHVMDEAERCSWLLLMRGGRLLAFGTPQQLMSDTSTTTVEAAFLALVGATEP